MVDRRKNIGIKKPFCVFLLTAVLSSCQAGGSSLLESYKPSDDFRNDWGSAKVFNRWIDPNLGAFLLMEESYLDLDRFELEKEYSVDQKPSVRSFRGKVSPGLVVVTSCFLPKIFEVYDLKAPNRYVTQISWQSDDLTFIGCRHGDGVSALAKAFTKRRNELKEGEGPRSRYTSFSLFHGAEYNALLRYSCMLATTKPRGRNDPETRNLFEVTATWSEVGFTLKADNSYLARSPW